MGDNLMAGQVISTDPWAGVLGDAESQAGLPYGLLSAISKQENVDPKHNNPLGLSTDNGVMSFDQQEAVDRIHRQARLLTDPSGPYSEFAQTGNIDALAKVYSPVGASNDLNGTNSTEADGIRQAMKSTGGTVVSTDPQALDKQDVVSTDPNAVDKSDNGLSAFQRGSNLVGGLEGTDAFQLSPSGRADLVPKAVQVASNARFGSDVGVDPNAPVSAATPQIQPQSVRPSFLPQSASQIDAADAKTAPAALAPYVAPALDKIQSALDYSGVSAVGSQLKNSFDNILEPFQPSAEHIRQFIGAAGNQFGGAGIESLLPQKAQVASQGLADSLSSQAHELASPQSIEILGSMMLLPEVGVGGIMNKAISLGFGAQSAAGMTQALLAARNEKDPQKFWALVGDAVGQGAVATLATAHGLRGGAAEATSDTPLSQPVNSTLAGKAPERSPDSALGSQPTPADVIPAQSPETSGARVVTAADVNRATGQPDAPLPVPADAAAPLPEASTPAAQPQTGQPVSLTGFHGTRSATGELDPSFRGLGTGATSASKANFYASDIGLAQDYADMALPSEALTARQALAKLEEEKQQLINTFSSEMPQAQQDAMHQQYSEIEAQSANQRKIISDHINARGMREELGGLTGDKNAKVLTHSLNFKNPLVVDMRGNEFREQTYSDTIDKAKAVGHDGVIFKNTFDPASGYRSSKPTDIYAQIGPATEPPSQPATEAPAEQVSRPEDATPAGVAPQDAIPPKVNQVGAIPTPEEELRYDAIAKYAQPIVDSISGKALDDVAQKLGIRQRGPFRDESAIRSKIMQEHPDDILDALPQTQLTPDLRLTSDPSSNPQRAEQASRPVPDVPNDTAPPEQVAPIAPETPAEPTIPPVEPVKAPEPSDPVVSRIANRFTHQRSTDGELGEIAPGQGYSTQDLTMRGLKMGPEEIAQHVSDLMQDTHGDVIKQASAVRAQEALLSDRAHQTGKAAQENPTDMAAKKLADETFQELTDFHNGPVAKIKERFHATGMALQGEMPVDLGNVNGLKEAWLKENGKAPPPKMEPVMRKMAERVTRYRAEDNVAMKRLGAAIDKEVRGKKLPSYEDVRNRIVERMKEGPCRV